MTWATGCAGLRVHVAPSAGAIDAVLVAPLVFRSPAIPATEYEKTAEVIEVLRATGALVIDASESEGAAWSRARAELAARLGHEPRVAVLRGEVERRDVDWTIPVGPTSGGVSPHNFMRYRVVAWHVRLDVTDGARTLASAAMDPDESDLGPGRAGVLDPAPVLTAGLRAATAGLARALAVRSRALPDGLAYVDTHRRMWRTAKADADAQQYFFSTLSPEQRRAIAAIDYVDGGVLVTAVPPAWRGRVQPGDVLLAVDGHAIDSAAACDRLLDAGEHRVRVAREGTCTEYTIGERDAPAGVRVAGAAR